MPVSPVQVRVCPFQRHTSHQTTQAGSTPAFFIPAKRRPTPIRAHPHFTAPHPNPLAQRPNPAYHAHRNPGRPQSPPARGCSSVVERQLPKLNVVGSIPITRFPQPQRPQHPRSSRALVDPRTTCNPRRDPDRAGSGRRCCFCTEPPSACRGRDPLPTPKHLGPEPPHPAATAGPLPSLAEYHDPHRHFSPFERFSREISVDLFATVYFPVHFPWEDRGFPNPL